MSWPVTKRPVALWALAIGLVVGCQPPTAVPPKVDANGFPETVDFAYPGWILEGVPLATNNTGAPLDLYWGNNYVDAVSLTRTMLERLNRFKLTPGRAIAALTPSEFQPQRYRGTLLGKRADGGLSLGLFYSDTAENVVAGQGRMFATLTMSSPTRGETVVHFADKDHSGYKFARKLKLTFDTATETFDLEVAAVFPVRDKDNKLLYNLKGLGTFNASKLAVSGLKWPFQEYFALTPAYKLTGHTSVSSRFTQGKEDLSAIGSVIAMTLLADGAGAFAFGLQSVGPAVSAFEAIKDEAGGLGQYLDDKGKAVPTEDLSSQMKALAPLATDLDPAKLPPDPTALDILGDPRFGGVMAEIGLKPGLDGVTPTPAPTGTPGGTPAPGASGTPAPAGSGTPAPGATPAPAGTATPTSPPTPAKP